MQELITLVLGHLRGIWKYRWIVVAAAWFISLLGWFFVLKMEDQFESSAKVHVDTQTILAPLMSNLAVDLNVRNRVALLTKTLLKQANLEKIVRMADLDLHIDNDPEAFSNLIKGLRKDIQLKPERRDNIYTISYAANDPQLAKLVVSSVLSLFEESALGNTRKDTEDAQDFLEKQIENYRQRLIEKENRLKDFKRTNVGFLPGASDYYQKLQAATERLSVAKLSLQEAENRRAALRLQVSTEEKIAQRQGGAEQSSRLTTKFDAKIERIETQLDALSLNYTDKHPDVISLRESLEGLEKKQEKALAKLTKAYGNGRAVLVSPVLQQIKISLSEAETTVSGLNTRVVAYQTKVEVLQTQVDTLPSIEAKLKDLNRDYGITKENFEELLSRLESIKMARTIEKTASNVKFNVVEPPIAPLKPSGPKRLIFLSVVLFLGIGAGVGFAFLISQLRATYDRQDQLAEDLDLPILGSVAMVWSTGQVLQRRFVLASFLLAFAGLLLVYGIIIKLLVQGIDLPGMVQRLAG